MSGSKIYSIPARFRRVENMHILLWLVKDACWALNYRTLGMIMIVPTLAVAFLITWQTRKVLSEFLHNLAVVFWIIANCTWMTGEFYGWDENLFGSFGLRRFALVPFSIGLMILAVYYLFILRRPGFAERMEARTREIVEQEMH